MNAGGGRLSMESVACVRGGRLLFEGVDVTLWPGDALVVTGPNGTGKSSLLRIAAGLLRQTAGRVERSAAALADENLALDPKLPLGRALAFWAALDGGRVGDGIAVMGINHLADVPVRMLSTGQRKRAVLARAIASGTPLWLLDEPANGLDGDGLERLAAAMQAHRANGGAILAATHQPIGLDAPRTLGLI